MSDFITRAAPDLLVCRPKGHQYGHLGMEMVMALGQARAERSSVAFIRPPTLINPAAFELDSDQVPIVRLDALSERVWRIRWRLRDLLEEWSGWRIEFHDELRTHLARLLREHATDQRNPESLRRTLRRWKQQLPAGRGPRPIAERPYLTRRSIREPIRVFLRPEVAAAARRQAEALGIRSGAPLVTVHAREPGYKRGREVHEKTLDSATRRDDNTRNVRIESYFPAIDDLVSLGYTVVRFGDPTMRAVRRPGVIDLALDARRTPELELHCLLESEFLLAGESGPSVMTMLTNTPTLTVNATDPVSSFPLRANWLYTLKRVVHLDTGRVLTLNEMASPAYLEAVRDSGVFRFLSSSPEEILEAVKEMRSFLAAPPPESPKQAAYRELITRTAETLGARMRYVRKWGPDEGFLGAGRVASFFVERYFT